MHRGRSGDYPEYPEIEAQLGYNPARFLDQRVGKDGQTAELSAKGLIRGIQDIETIRAWIEVEVALGWADGGSRQQVITWLNRRQAHIQEDRSELSASTATTDDRDRPSSSGDERPTDHSEPASDAETTEPVSAEPSTTAAIDDGEDEPIGDPTCPVCGETLTPEHIAGQRGFWCLDCRDFREPASDLPAPSIPISSTAPSGDDVCADATASDVTPGESSTTATAVATDGGATDPDTPPRCSECHGELPEETVGDGDDAHWCSYCGRVVQVETRVAI